MRTVNVSEITENIKEMCIEANHYLSKDMEAALKHSQETEASPTIVTEERRKGTAQFRCLGFGDVSHLYAGGEEPSFAARFCECYDDDTRHD